MSKVASCLDGAGKHTIMAASSKLSALSHATFGLEHLQLESKARPKGPQGSSSRRCQISEASRSKEGVSSTSRSRKHEGGTQSRETQSIRTSTIQSLDRFAYDENAHDNDPAATDDPCTSNRWVSGSSNRSRDSEAKDGRLTNVTASADHSPSIARLPPLPSLVPVDFSRSLSAPSNISKAPVMTEASDRSLDFEKGRPVSSSDKHHLPFKPAPRPSAEYLTRAYTKPCSVDSPQHLLLVLDLNGTLLFRAHPNKSFHPRPWLHQFLDYCFANHSVLIWSSARPHNVMKICNKLFSADQRSRLLGEWARDKLNLTKAQYNQRLQVYKRLDSIWQDKLIQSRHPLMKQGHKWGQHNTVLIDDNALKASAQPFNHLALPEYGKQQVVAEERLESEGKGVLLQVIDKIQELSCSNDVSYFLSSVTDAKRLSCVSWGR